MNRLILLVIDESLVVKRNHPMTKQVLRQRDIACVFPRFACWILLTLPLMPPVLATQTDKSADKSPSAISSADPNLLAGAEGSRDIT